VFCRLFVLNGLGFMEFSHLMSMNIPYYGQPPMQVVPAQQQRPQEEQERTGYRLPAGDPCPPLFCFAIDLIPITDCFGAVPEGMGQALGGVF
jgi:hypothetical protein